MTVHLETLGNATLQLFQDRQPVLATDPWLVGTCYYGSWALEQPLTEAQIRNVQASQYIWISHGHPDHLHHDSLALIPKGKKVLIPDHYDRDIYEFLKSRQFDVTIMKYRRWVDLTPRIRCLCLDNPNQDAILVVQADDALIIDLNDSPLCGETGFLRRLVRRHGNGKAYLLALCAVDADMINIVDEQGAFVGDPPHQRKPGMIWRTARMADRLGVKNFCCSSSQHLYIRSDSVWANDYRITWADMRRHWSRPNIRLIQPFVTVNLQDGSYVCNHPSQQPDLNQISHGTADDDWDARLTEDEWSRVEDFVKQFETLRDYIDFLEFTVGGERRRFMIAPSATAESPAALRGVHFRVPRNSFLETVKWGYFDDLLIGNFMKTQLFNVALYPHVTPSIAKLGGSAKVFTKAQKRQFHLRYLKRNPIGFAAWQSESLGLRLVDWLRRVSERFGFKAPLKRIYRYLLGDPVA